MSSLAQALQLDSRSDELVAQCLALIHRQIDSGGRLRRMSLRAALAILDSIRPQALNRLIHRLLPAFAEALDPLYVQFSESQRDEFSPFLMTHSAPAVAALLGVAAVVVEAYERGTLQDVWNRSRRSTLFDRGEQCSRKLLAG
mgnify:CR=1 FL=1